ncbi:unnamed protein product [Phaedon cochleariae]|uniref:APAF-1 helical domain-containing protein n=1 Tax=Phaedon cochleariae TaxID=80249 RepID=A0A9N9SJW4_PHACE|nr:unnamed protein product [Phaedon cochleariae]
MTQENALEEKLRQYKDFIDRKGGHLYSYDKTDIIQYALCESKDSHVFKEALKLAKHSARLYFQLQKPCEELDYSEIINIRDDITAACFVDSPQHILIGTTNGKIKLFYEQSVKEISSFVGHAGAIKNLIVSPDKVYFLSVSIDGTILLWKFAADSSRNSRDFTNEVPISPKTRQSYWQDIHTPDRGQVSPRKRFQVHDSDDFLISAAFCSAFPDTFRIVTGSNRGNVVVWDAMNETQLYRTGHRGLPAPCVMYCEKEGRHFVKFACQDSIFVYEIEDEKISLAKSLDTFYDEDKSVHILLIGSDSKTLQQCQIQPYEREPQMEYIPVFMPYWKTKNALTAIVSEENRIQSGEIRHFEIKTKIDEALCDASETPVTYLKCYDASNAYQYRGRLGSGSSSDSLDLLDRPEGMVVCVFGNDRIAVFKQGDRLERSILKPLIFYKNSQMVIVDSFCGIYKWDLDSDNFVQIENRHIFEPVWKTFDKYPTISLDLHDDPVEDLLFSPNMEPILVSLGEQIAWWNLKSFLETKKKRGRPKSIDILDNLSCDLRSMNISLWGDRQPLPGCSHLLACIKLNGKAKYVSASNDFNSFLTIDDNGKVYIMEIVHPDS